MSANLKKLLETERNHVLTPDDEFASRVLARLDSQDAAPSGVWDAIPAVGPPLLGILLTIAFVVLMIQILVPIPPTFASVTGSAGQDNSASQVLIASPVLPHSPEN